MIVHCLLIIVHCRRSRENHNAGIYPGDRRRSWKFCPLHGGFLLSKNSPRARFFLEWSGIVLRLGTLGLRWKNHWGSFIGSIIGSSSTGLVRLANSDIKTGNCSSRRKTEVQGSITSALPNLLGKIIAPFSKKSPPEVQTATVVTEEDTKSSTEVEVIVESEGDTEAAETDTVESTADEEKETAKQEVEATPTVEDKEATVQQEVEATPTVEKKETTAQQEVEATATEQQEAIEVEIAAAEVETPEEQTPETTPVDSKSESTEVSSESGEKKG